MTSYHNLVLAVFLIFAKAGKKMEEIEKGKRGNDKEKKSRSGKGKRKSEGKVVAENREKKNRLRDKWIDLVI